MLSKFTLLAATEYPQAGGLDYPLTAATAYLWNTNRIRKVEAINTTDSQFEYVFEPDARQGSNAVFKVTANVEDFAVQFDLSPTTNLPSFTLVRDWDDDVDLDATTTVYFPLADIVLADEYATGRTALYVSYGGVTVRQYVVSDTLDAILAKV